MSAILVESQETINGATYFELSSGKKSAFISWHPTLGIRVICQNASHSVWRGAGRGFDSWTEAKEGYKSSDMRAMIEYAESAMAPALRLVG